MILRRSDRAAIRSDQDRIHGPNPFCRFRAAAPTRNKCCKIPPVSG